MDLQHLRYFVVLAEELNFSRAALRLHLSQPHLTRSVARIEKELGLKLLHRTTRQVKLTPAGETFWVEAQAVLTRLEEALQTVRQTANVENGRLGLAFTEIALHGVVPEILAAFRDRVPNVRLDVLEACTEEQVEALRTARVDVGFLHPPLRVDFLSLLPIDRERLAIALPIGHLLATQSKISLKALAKETLILHPRDDGPFLYDTIVEICEKAGFSPKIVHKTTEQTFLGLVTAGVGVCFIPPSVQNVKNPGVAIVPIEGDAPTLELAVAWRHCDRSPYVEVFLDVVKMQSINGLKIV